MIALRHPQLGTIEVADTDVIRLQAPLPPFAGLRRYVLLPDPEHEPFLWLQSVDQPALFFIVAPHEAVAGPPPRLAASVREQLGLQTGEEPESYVIISLADDPRQVTMNLLAPLVLCRRTRRARQAMREGDITLTRVPLL